MIQAIKDQRRTMQPAVFAELEDVEDGKYCNEA